MKKTYIIPTTTCVAVFTERFFAGSLTGLGEDGGDVKTNSDELNEGVDGESRIWRSLWDD